MLGEGLDPAVAFGRVPRRLRIEKGLTQEQLALEADLQRNYVSLMERGRNQPSLTTLFKLAKALDRKPSAMVELTHTELQVMASTPIRKRRITLRG